MMRILLLVAVVLFARPAGAQIPAEPVSFVETQWTVRDGLPVNRLSMSELLQSHDGYLWLSTRDGLVRFDGLRFTTFTMDNADGLASNRILHLYETPDGTLWLVTEEGLLIRHHDRRFATVLTSGGSEPSAVNRLYADPDGRLFAATDHGVYRIDEGVLEPYYPKQIVDAASALLVDSRGDMWIGTKSRGVLHLSNGRVTRFTTREGLSENAVVELRESADGRIWVQHASAEVPLSRYADGRFMAARLGQGGHLIDQDRHGRLWATAGQALFYYDAGSWRRMPADHPLLTQLSAHGDGLLVRAAEVLPAETAAYSIRDSGSRLRHGSPVVRDREANWWIASPTDGLFRLTPPLFRAVSGFEDPNLYAIAESRDGSMWFTSLSGVVSQLTPRGRLRHYDASHAVKSGRMAVYEDRAGNLWVNQTICRPTTGRSCATFESVEPLADTQVLAITEDRAGHFWFGTLNGLFRLTPGPDPASPHTGRWTHFTTEDGLTHNHVRVVVESRHGGLWLGTNGGGVVHYEDGQFSGLRVEDGLSSNSIRALYEDERGVLWVGTEDLGLNRVELDSSRGPLQLAATVFSFRASDGLHDNGLHAILEDDAGRLWMSTNRGIFWVSRSALDAYAAGKLERLQSTAYSTRDGLPDQEANGGTMHAAIRASDGRIWFATQAGAVVVDPSAIHPNPIPPSVVIEQATVQRESVTIDGNTLRLPLGRRDFDVSYTGVSLGAPDLVRFRYRLEGYESTWVEAGDRRAAYYTQVPPGRYTFQVIAANNDGVWNARGATMTVLVPAFFYETTWFRGLMALLVLGVIVLLYEMRLYTVRSRERELARRVEEHTHELRVEKEKTEEQARRLLELDDLQRQFYANISHEFRTPLTVIVGPLQQLIAGRYGALPGQVQTQHEMMLRNSHRLLRLIDQILDLSHIEAKALELHCEPQDLAELVAEAVMAFSPLAEHRQIELTLQQVNPGHAFVFAFDRDLIEKVIANLLSNALKFTSAAGRVSVELEADIDAVSLRVVDDGCGIPADRLEHIFDRFYQVDGGSRRAHQGSGIGLALVKEFVELHEGSVSVESTHGVGTTFTVRLPRALPTSGDGIPGQEHPTDSTNDRFLQPKRYSGDGADIFEPEIRPSSGLGRDRLSDAVRPQKPSGDVVSEAASEPGTSEAPSEPGTNESSSEPLTDERAVATESDTEDRTTILVVDDNADTRAFIRSVLEPRYRVLEAGDGRDGLSVARDALPDLIIADVMMPRLDGLDLNRELKQDRDLDCVPVILLTARAAEEDQVAGHESEADAYVTKPFAPDVLAAHVQALLRIRSRLRDRLRRQAAVPARTDALDVDLVPLPVRARRFVEAHLDDPALSVSALAEEAALSTSQLRRRLSDETGLTPSAFIRHVRLETAAELLKNRAGNVTEIVYAVGFQSLSSFTRAFRDHFGMTPSAYRDAS